MRVAAITAPMGIMIMKPCNDHYNDNEGKFSVMIMIMKKVL